MLKYIGPRWTIWRRKALASFDFPSNFISWRGFKVFFNIHGFLKKCWILEPHTDLFLFFPGTTSFLNTGDLATDERFFSQKNKNLKCWPTVYTINVLSFFFPSGHFKTKLENIDRWFTNKMFFFFQCSIYILRQNTYNIHQYIIIYTLFEKILYF